MIRKQVGNGSDLAEIIIDYKKKKISMLDPENRFKFKENRLDFSSTPDAIIIISMVVVIALAMDFGIGIGFKWVIYPITIILAMYLIMVFATPIRKKIQKLIQFISNDFFKVKKFIIVKDIKSKVYKLPYDFENVKLDYKLSGDYAKYIEKVHILPKQYYYERWGKRELQDEEWEAYFYFSKVPKKGKMKIRFI